MLTHATIKPVFLIVGALSTCVSFIVTLRRPGLWAFAFQTCSIILPWIYFLYSPQLINCFSQKFQKQISSWESWFKEKFMFSILFFGIGIAIAILVILSSKSKSSDLTDISDPILWINIASIAVVSFYLHQRDSQSCPQFILTLISYLLPIIFILFTLVVIIKASW